LLSSGLVFASALFRREVGVQVHLCGLDLLVAEPQRDHGGVDPCVQQAHRGGVAEHVRSDRLLAQRGTTLRRSGGVLGDPASERLTGERPAGAGGEQRLAAVAVSLGLPDFEHGDGRFGQRRDPLLASLPDRCRVRAGAEVDVTASKAGQLAGS